MSQDADMRRQTGTFDRETGFIVDDGYVSASQVQTALGIQHHLLWRRTLAVAGISPYVRPATGSRTHWLRRADARRLLAASKPAEPP